MKTKMKKNFQMSTIALMSVLLGVSLTGCGTASKTSNSGPSTATPAAPTASTAAATVAPTPEAKKLSGKIVVYSAGPADLATNIQKGFKAKTGVEVEMFQGTTGKILARMEAEKANPVVDVVVLASLPSAIGMTKSGLTLPFKEAKNADKLISDYSDKDGNYFSYSLSALGIAYNTKTVTNPPKEWSDLTKPEWKDKVNIPDPAQSGSALDFMTGYANKNGDSAWDLFGKVKANGAIIAGANQEAMDPVISGAKSIVMASVDYMTYASKAKGEPIDLIYPASGTVISPRPAMIMKSSKNVDASKAFIEYLLSDEAQKMVTDSYLLSGRSDIQVQGRVSAKDIPAIKVDWNWMNDNQAGVTQKFTQLFKK
ncbi:ABC transporter substrate-binding protein [Paenibacillus sp. CGMCC 1.16610]|uniref:Extracellular solute-binding protein n=1 Tax=Paenibacillus anseongense TaxID=2682845 RepID=A0ABW9UAI9_9BACL|nr:MULTISPECIES: ABC transporter substrate-binding protein [Paenibacillus]MBA2940596.1 ABC transporter substrate-binding protein [Paenibacillus sp. CGMCC 1.16610]MVQ35773.1 extracellular solute-binding protein [Paenibacillus anseongense]